MNTPDPVELLADLVAIPSVNPMGRPVEGPEYYEAKLTDYLEQFFARIGVAHRRQSVAPGRENILAMLPPVGWDDERCVLWEVHQDTVPVDAMTIEPFTPTQRDGRLYGRGACDVKGGMAAMLAAFAGLAASAQSPRPRVVLACTVNEEHGYSGARALVKLWTTERDAELFPAPPSEAIVAEPTCLNVVVAHKGAVRWRLHTLGRAAHSSNPSAGENAIYAMADVVAALRQYAAESLVEFPAHPLCGRPTLSVGVISGGLSVNTVPDRCTIEIDRRLAPGEDAESARAAVVEMVSQRVPNARVEHDAPFIVGPALAGEANGKLAERLAALAAPYGEGVRLGAPYGTDAAVISAAGVPAVVFGPGDIAQAHSADEWIELAQLQSAVEVLLQAISAD